MMSNKIGIFLICSAIFYVLGAEINIVEAAKTGSYNFCTQFPTFPECTGYRTEAIDDNYWFCQYVNLVELCKNPPDPEKEIELKKQNDCCQYIGKKIEKTDPISIEQNNQSNNSEKIKNNLESIAPLIIWTDKDHYNFRDKTIVYGKFDFTNPSIIENIKNKEFNQAGEIIEERFTVDIKLNGDLILHKIPVTSSGWFTGYFYHNNIYKFSTQNNFLEVEYIITQGQIPSGGPKTHATYQFTTGDIFKTKENLDMWVDESEMPNKIQFGIIAENSKRFLEHARHDLVITRITTPEGFVIPIDSNYSIRNVSSENTEFSKYGYGTYEIQITYGDSISKSTFEYTSP